MRQCRISIISDETTVLIQEVGFTEAPLKDPKSVQLKTYA